MEFNTATSGAHLTTYSANAPIAPLVQQQPHALARCMALSSNITRSFSYCTTPVGGAQWYS